MLQILKEIYSDVEMAACMGFKGGTATMFFYDLPRFSVDLDFNLLQPEKENEVYEKIRKILLKYGKIDDEAQKFFGPILVLDYGIGERKLKIEISNRIYNNHYEVRNFMGINMLVMTQEDMFAHKLCALLERKTLTNRDIFDCWFFMQRGTSINKELLESRVGKTFSDYVQDCIDRLDNVSNKGLLNGLGELLDDKMKTFVRTKLRTETITLLNFYKQFPILKS
jgi:predicted nucleotidyltransferase component of viral defense system